MPTTLTPRSIAGLKPGHTPFYVTDTVRAGLQLRVALDGSKTWSYRYRINRTMRRLTLGDTTTLSLADARRRGKEAAKLVSAGIDPAEHKQVRRNAPTVADFAATYIEQHAKPKLRRWKGVKSRLDNDVLPRWKHRLMRDITRRDVRELVDEIAARPAPISANRVRSLLHKFFNVAIQHDVVASNPVSGTPSPGVEQRRDRILTDDEIRQFWNACDALSLEMAAAWKVRLLTAQRASEVHNMTWQELDLEAGAWTIPAERSKNKKRHSVPLSPPVLTLLKALRADADSLIAAREARGDTRSKPITYVLAGARGMKQRAAAAATFGLADFKGHDLRHTAATLMTERSGTSEFVVGKILNHTVPSITARYNHYEYAVEKQAALNNWAHVLTAIIAKKNSNVVAFATR